MKIIEEQNKKLIILEENEKIEVKTLYDNPTVLEISCHEQTLIINEKQGINEMK